MRDLATILGSKVTTSVCVNGIWVPANSIGKAIVSYIDPALFHTSESAPYDLSISGSIFRFKYRRRYFAVSTQHQLDCLDFEHHQLGIINFTDPDQKLTTSQGAVFDTSGSHDLCLFEFTDPVRKGSLPEGIWFDANLVEFGAPTPQALVCLCIGYPGFENYLDYEEFRLDSAAHEIPGEMCEPQLSNRLSFRPLVDITFDPSGMSGSPVFGLLLKNFQPQLFFAGILSNASRKAFNFVPAMLLGRYLKQIIED